MDGQRPISRLRRRLARFRERLAPTVDYVYSPEYEFQMPYAPYDGLRGERILAALFHSRRIRTDHLHEPAAVSMRALRRVHTDDYLDRLLDPAVTGEIVGARLDAEGVERVLDIQRRAVGGTLLATAHALYSGRIAVNLGGGLHHAHASRGAGFCLFNDLAVAIARQRLEGFAERILVVDLDLHDGDGTRALFADDPTVFTFSIHNVDWGDPEAEASFSKTLSGEVEDAEYLSAVGELLPPIVERFRPELVYYVAGCDPAADDKIGNWKITAAGMLARDRFVIDAVARLAPTPPMVVVLGGGYGDESWRYSARFLSSLYRDEAVEPPTTGEVTLMHYRRMARDLRLEEESTDDDNDWGLTEEDLVGVLAGTGGDHRLLGRYSRHEFELAIERLGFMDRLRERGFLYPYIEFQPDGEGLVVYSDPQRTEPLIELIMGRDGHTRPGREFLRVEWLLMQNPRRSFAPGRPRLPGQKHPGLGLLYDVTSILIVACEQLELDGILFVPAHFHLAAQGHKVLRCLDPEDEAFFRRLLETFQGIPLTAALTALEQGRLRSLSDDSVIAWRPMAMVLPTSRRLKAELEGADYDRAVEAAQSALRWVLVEAPTGPAIGSS